MEEKVRKLLNFLPFGSPTVTTNNPSEVALNSRNFPP